MKIFGRKTKTSTLNKKITLTDLNLFFAVLLIPIVIFQIAYSSVLLIIISLLTICNFIFKRDRVILTKKKLTLFFIYFICILISFFIDLYYGFYDVKFIVKNIIIIIIPLFVFSSNFNKKAIYKILNFSSILISFLGLIILLFWFFGYQNYVRTNEFEKDEWFKQEVNLKLVKQEANVTISPLSKKPSLRKVINVTRLEVKDTIVREFLIKKTNQEFWVLMRGSNSGENKRAWFNTNNGNIGFVDSGIVAKTELQEDNYYKFILKNKIHKGTLYEWFYVSFVSENLSYLWNEKLNSSDISFNLKTPNCHFKTGKNLLAPLPLTSYGLTKFTFLEHGTHKTYIGLAFLFSLIILIYQKKINNSLKIILLVLNIIVLFGLASKAIILSLFVIIIFFARKLILEYKFILLSCLLGLFFLKDTSLIKSTHMFQRFNDMYQTIIKVNKNQDLQILDNLSTNSRINIYKNYISLTKNNIFGYGHLNGKEIYSKTNDVYFNSHNQFVQIFFNSGIIGFCLFILFLTLIFYKFEIKKDLFLFILVLYFNFIFESILYRQWGLIIISFVFSIYIQNSKNSNKWSQ